jgi:hypothetical protein
VSRGLSEFHGRRPVLFTATGEAVLALPVEGLDRQRLAEFIALCGPVAPQLIITERRALALGLDASTPMALTLSAGDNANTILALVTDATNHRMPAATPASPAAAAAIQLVKISQSLPAVLAAEMRTYQLQDNGLDTFDANTTLGFDDDERDYGIAAHMLRMLNCTRIVLLTNNPAKLDGLTKAGIEIASRMPLDAPVNADNRRYMTAKAARAGPQFDHPTASLADQA